jgi:hypothetical protein
MSTPFSPNSGILIYKLRINNLSTNRPELVKEYFGDYKYICKALKENNFGIPDTCDTYLTFVIQGGLELKQSYEIRGISDQKLLTFIHSAITMGLETNQTYKLGGNVIDAIYEALGLKRDLTTYMNLREIVQMDSFRRDICLADLKQQFKYINK